MAVSINFWIRSGAIHRYARWWARQVASDNVGYGLQTMTASMGSGDANHPVGQCLDTLWIGSGGTAQCSFWGRRAPFWGKHRVEHALPAVIGEYVLGAFHQADDVPGVALGRCQRIESSWCSGLVGRCTACCLHLRTDARWSPGGGRGRCLRYESGLSRCA